jgi:hypothetical protein
MVDLRFGEMIVAYGDKFEVRVGAAMFRRYLRSSPFSAGFPGLLARADGKHGHDDPRPLDRGCEKRWGKDVPINHDSRLLVPTHWLVVV